MSTHENELSEKEAEEQREPVAEAAQEEPARSVEEIPHASELVPANVADVVADAANPGPIIGELTPASEVEQAAQDQIDAMIEAQRNEDPSPAYDMRRQAVLPVGGSFAEKSGTPEERQRTLPIGSSA